MMRKMLVGAAVALSCLVTGAATGLPVLADEAQPVARSSGASRPLEFSVAATSVAVGESVRTKGQVATLGVRQIQVQESVRGTWKTVVSGRTSKTGAFRLTLRPRGAADTRARLRAVAPPTAVAGRSYEREVSQVQSVRIVEPRLRRFGQALSTGPVVSGNGRYVAFMGNVNGARNRADVYLHDVRSGATRRIATGDYNRTWGISSDGRFVAYEKLTSRDLQEVFLYDSTTRTTQLVHRSTTGAYFGGTLSGDGSHVAFAYSEEVPGGQGLRLPTQVYIYERGSQSTTRFEAEGAGGPALSHDGRYLTFQSDRLDASSDVYAVYSYEMATGAITRVSPTDLDFCASSDMSSDGRYVVFDCGESLAVIVRYDRISGQVLMVDSSRSVLRLPAISGDGRYIAYESCEPLGGKDTNRTCDVVVADAQTGTKATPSLGGNAISNFPDISADGGSVAFSSEATDLVNGDTNKTADIFFWTR